MTLNTAKVAALAVLAGAAANKLPNAAQAQPPEAVKAPQSVDPGDLAQGSLPVFRLFGEENVPLTQEKALPRAPNLTIDPGSEFKGPARVIAECLEAGATIAVVRKASREERRQVVSGLSQDGELDPAAEHFLCKTCLSILSVEETLPKSAAPSGTIIVLGACPGGRMRMDDPPRKTPAGMLEEPTVEIFASFSEGPERAYLAFLVPARSEYFDSEGADCFERLLSKGAFVLDPPNVFVLQDRRAGYPIDAKAVSAVPSEFLNDLRLLLSGQPGPPQTELGHAVLGHLKALADESFSLGLSPPP